MRKFRKYNRINESINPELVEVVYIETSDNVYVHKLEERIQDLKAEYPDAEFALFSDYVYQTFDPDADAYEIYDWIVNNPYSSDPDWNDVYDDFEKRSGGFGVMAVSDDFDITDVPAEIADFLEIISISTGEVLSAADESNDEPEIYNESVSERFAKYRSIFESDESEDDSDEAGEEGEDDAEDDEKKEDDSEEDGDEEEKPLTGIIIQVKKKDVDALKDELEKYDIVEDDITVFDEDKEDDDTVDVKIDIEKALELKDYLKEKKNIDLEDKLGVEFVEDEEGEGDEEGDEKKDDKGEEKDGEEGEGDTDDDSYTDFGDIFDVK